MSSSQLFTSLCLLVTALMLANEVQGCPRPILRRVKNIRNPFKSPPPPPRKKLDISWPVNRPVKSKMASMKSINKDLKKMKKAREAAYFKRKQAGKL
ncbi:hypothetical protein BOX15_Mlig009388g1 [Macrostomum lignano]|uniref:Uncharacterized protein n=1 Tax=Macrostomum lignano TaxID=282301 RepID=A0A267EKJ8_9PLAT|nr:hypothetical protein BOX15_Mlig009388g2 [Macrostomum lignano]PAA62673.1 hypothetical protein BOX15_Mlig009388g1 [Macrostomum lignano]